MRIYIAGALSSKEKKDRTPSEVVVDYIANLTKMCRVAAQVRRLGYYPYVPGLDFMLGLVDGSFEEEEYRGMGMSFLEVCDIVLVTSMSWGVKQEIKRATELNIPIIFDIHNLPPRRI